MPKLKAKLPLPGEEAIKRGVPYQIVVVEPFTSEVQKFVGQRVVLEDKKGKQLAIALWEREVAGLKSKLGAFLTVLGDDTDTWAKKTIVFLKWAERDRQIELVK